MNLCPVLGCSPTALVLILEPCVVGIDKQGPVIPVGIHGIPHVRAIISIGMVLGVKLSEQVGTLERVLPLYQWSGISVGNLHIRGC